MADVFERPWHGTETAGELSLSFVNTLDWRLREAPVELLKGYPDLLRWARTVVALRPEEARALRSWGEAHPRSASRALGEAIELREAIAAIYEAAFLGTRPPASPLKRLDEACRAARGAQALRTDGDGIAWAWRSETPEPERPAWAAALAASRLLTSEEIARVRQCGDAECGWYFLDTSKNKSRRWCSMEACGNRNKARSFYRRSTGKVERGNGDS